MFGRSGNASRRAGKAGFARDTRIPHPFPSDSIISARLVAVGLSRLLAARRKLYSDVGRNRLGRNLGTQVRPARRLFPRSLCVGIFDLLRGLRGLLRILVCLPERLRRRKCASCALVV